MKICFTWLVLVGLSLSVAAQSYLNEGIGYSSVLVGGTARSTGAGGAFNSVGADQGALAINPAGIGLYRTSDFSLSTSAQINQNTSTYLNQTGSSDFTKFNLNQVGLVWVRGVKKKSGFYLGSGPLRSFAFGISYLQLNQFRNDFSFNANNATNSLAESLTQSVNASGKPVTPENYPLETFLAYYAYLINYDSSVAAFTTPVSLPVNQQGNIRQTGSTNELQLTFGANLNDKWYVGGALGIPFMSYSVQRSFSETSDTSNQLFNTYTLSSSYKATGTGFNLKLGVIYRPFSWWRVGASFKTPDFYSMQENYGAQTVSSVFDTTFQVEASYEPFKFSYRTPLLASFGTSFYFSKYGFFSVDYDLTSYGLMRFNFPSSYDVQESALNQSIKSNLGMVHRLRAGVELAYKWARCRGGFQYSSSPYQSGNRVKDYDQSVLSYSAGLGYRGKRFYVDLTYLRTSFGNQTQLYQPVAGALPEWKMRSNANLIMLTLGLKFGKGI